MQTETNTTVLKLRPFREADHETLIAWALNCAAQPLPPYMYPRNGYVVESEGAAIASGFVFFTDAPVAWVDLLAFNHLVEIPTRTRAIRLIISALISDARKRGCLTIAASYRAPETFKDIYESHGFTVETKLSVITKSFDTALSETSH